MGMRRIIGSALADAFAKVGEDAVFTPLSGDPVPLKVFVEFGVALEPDGFEGPSRQQAVIIEALLADLPHEPQKGEAFAVTEDGVTATYKVGRVIGNDRFTVKVACKET